MALTKHCWSGWDRKFVTTVTRVTGWHHEHVQMRAVSRNSALGDFLVMQQGRDRSTVRFTIIHNIGVSRISLPLIYALLIGCIVIHLLYLNIHLLVVVHNCQVLLPVGFIPIWTSLHGISGHHRVLLWQLLVRSVEFLLKVGWSLFCGQCSFLFPEFSSSHDRVWSAACFIVQSLSLPLLKRVLLIVRSVNILMLVSSLRLFKRYI